MGFKRGLITVEDIRPAEQTALAGRVLELNTAGLLGHLKTRDGRITQCSVSVARPGDLTRIACVKDVIQPGCKVAGEEPGAGRRHVLANVTVITCGRIVGFQEGIIDMSGPGAPFSPFSAFFNIVLDISVAPGLSPHQHEESVRNAGIAAADYIGRACCTAVPDSVQSFPCLDPPPATSELPKIVYLYMLLSQGLLHDSYVLGRNARAGLPRIMEPAMVLDNAITSGNCVSACDKNTSWHHQNNPVIQELFRRHERELFFAGVVLTNEPVRLAAKEASAAQAIDLVRQFNPDGVILSKEGFGNPDADQMLLTRGLEQAGIKVVAITDEFAGVDGFSQSLADSALEADAVVSTGNANARLILPPMDCVIGPVIDLNRLAGATSRARHTDGSLEVELQTIIGATNELGMQCLRCREV